MSRTFVILLGIGIAVATLGCEDAPTSSTAARPVTPEPETASEPPDQSGEGVAENASAGVDTPEPLAEMEFDEEPPVNEAAPAETQEVVGETELELEGIRFVVPGGWKRVKPQTNIVEAEYELSHAPEDEHDGRLTLMSSGGDPQDVIANRTTEFIREPGSGPRIEPLPIGRIEATWVDLQGEWKGPTFRPIDPRPDYRMLLVIIPFTERSAFYAKLTGPRATVEMHEAAFRAFVQSAQITMPQRESATPRESPQDR